MTTSTTAEHSWLRTAIELATRSVTEGGGPFGAVVVRDGEVVGEGTNRVTATLDPTAHAEVVAIRAACRALGRFRLTGCVLVSSCEPCPLCLAAALWARVDRIVYAADRHDAAAAGFDDREFHDLFGRPRETWNLAVERITTDDDAAPFAAWLSRTDRVDY
ncbi:nucleoside deaminase [Saccharothrix coeruleofusca]|uniref:tRNA-specific adenosine deaminase n=1 Tax=Saccharothrix coeruleofusca TaxID=33919 RepID=A0A918APL2_9PSEU|nr:nucleoside deaminase [Saccharothrix coeruleofusca]MBP2337155.1 tRNA(Arg) A34 adenosine deaminase TadA [Saccharothrix coeruleofusca]GGP66728.1 tRNA-specific adenosine deaminase [Saccharothrix coeruleofusca]